LLGVVDHLAGLIDAELCRVEEAAVLLQLAGEYQTGFAGDYV